MITRKSTRYDEIGRIDAPQICAVPGVLENISKDGCKVHFPVPVALDIENDYELVMTPASTVGGAAGMRFTLLCHPQWAQEGKGSTEIGFAILRSPDYPRFAEFVQTVEDKAAEGDDGRA